MSNVCDYCGKGVISGKNVSNSNRRTRRRWLPNLHCTHLLVGTTKKKLWLCTKCLRKVKERKYLSYTK